MLGEGCGLSETQMHLYSESPHTACLQCQPGAHSSRLLEPTQQGPAPLLLRVLASGYTQVGFSRTLAGAAWRDSFDRAWALRGDVRGSPTSAP